MISHKKLTAVLISFFLLAYPCTFNSPSSAYALNEPAPILDSTGNVIPETAAVKETPQAPATETVASWTDFLAEQSPITAASEEKGGEQNPEKETVPTVSIESNDP